MRELMERAMEQYGVEITIQKEGEEVRLRAFFQPSRSKARQNMEREWSPLGAIPGGQYVYIGPAKYALQAGDTLLVGEAAYTVQRMEQICSNGELLYLWGLCQKKGGDDGWLCQV
jgi:hypothetical protein